MFCRQFGCSIAAFMQACIVCTSLSCLNLRIDYRRPSSADDGFGMNNATFVGRAPAACALRCRSVRGSARLRTGRCCAVHAGEGVSK